MFRYILRIDSHGHSLIFTSQPIRSVGDLLTAEYLPRRADIILSDLCFEEDNWRPDLLIILVHHLRSASGSDAGAELTLHLCVSL